MRIALVQDSPPSHPGDVLANVEAWIAKSVAHGAALVVFPELYYPGFHRLLAAWQGDGGAFARFSETAQPIPGPLTDAVGAFARAKGLHVVFTLLERGDAGRLYNSAILMGTDGSICLKHRKTMLTPEIEAGRLDRGERYDVVETPIGRIGMLICADATCPEPARILALRGAELVCVCSGDFRSSWQVEGRDMADQIWTHASSAPTRALDNNVFWLAVNAAGTQSGCAFLGGSRVISPIGEIIAHAGRGPEARELLCAEIDLSLRRRVEAAFSVMKRRRPELYGDLVQPRTGHK